VPSALPDGDPAPYDGSLPTGVLAALAAQAPTPRPFGVYLHVPFCTTRCGYCDFNTYTSDELGPGASRATYAETVVAELELAHRVLGAAGGSLRPVSSVFVGGGTPTLLPSADLGRMLAAVRDLFGLTADAEVTTEANPDSVTAASLAELRSAGFTRVSFGMQSAVPHVLATLERTHTPGRVAEAVGWARAAGFEQVSLDLIYGTPGESPADWQRSLDAALELAPDHVSAYSLIVEEGTRLAGRIRRGELPMPDDDQLADAYLVADSVLGGAGFGWYEVSNWARTPGAQCRHNLTYWRSDDWWGAGPGAHSHVGGVRWWNVKHPAAYAARIADGASPAHAREELTDEDRRVETVLLAVRLAEGCDVDVLHPAGRAAAERLAVEGLVDPAGLAAGRVTLTLRGRLLADAVVRDLVD
jgi:putative oxygen-independent coproporphyrinogen III oxidase